MRREERYLRERNLAPSRQDAKNAKRLLMAAITVRNISKMYRIYPAPSRG